MKNLPTSLLLLLVAMSVTNCQCPGDDDDGSTTGPGPIVRNHEIPIFLGNRLNDFHLDKTYYAGPRVARFKLTFEFIVPGGTVGWREGVTLRLLDMGGNELESFDRTTPRIDGPFESEFIEGNAARIEVTSGGTIVNLDGEARLEVRRVELELLDDDVASVPFALEPGREIIALSQETRNGSQEYTFDVPDDYILTSVYVSPFNDSVFNNVGASMAVGVDAPSTSFMAPVDTDTGLYHELNAPPGSQLSISVRMGFATHYWIVIQRVASLHDVVAEMDETLTPGQARIFDRGEFEDTVRDFDPTNQPHYRQQSEYIQPRQTYPGRIRELSVLASARALDATEGYLRFDDIDLFHSYDSLRDVDIHFADDCDRAYSGSQHIVMFLNQLDSPVFGGFTFFHEWAHRDYAMLDEYVDVELSILFSTPIDWNTVMASFFASEFCSYNNHANAPSVANYPADSNWSYLASLYGILPPGPAALGLYPQNQASYFDVLNKLEQLMSFNEITNDWDAVEVAHEECP